MFNVGTQELLVILLVVLLLFGAQRVPEVARALGKGVGDVRDALSGIERELKGEPPIRRPVRRLLPDSEGKAESPVPRHRAVPGNAPSAHTPEPADRDKLQGRDAAGGANDGDDASRSREAPPEGSGGRKSGGNQSGDNQSGGYRSGGNQSGKDRSGGKQADGREITGTPRNPMPDGPEDRPELGG